MTGGTSESFGVMLLYLTKQQQCVFGLMLWSRSALKSQEHRVLKKLLIQFVVLSELARKRRFSSEI